MGVGFENYGYWWLRILHCTVIYFDVIFKGSVKCLRPFELMFSISLKHIGARRHSFYHLHEILLSSDSIHNRFDSISAAIELCRAAKRYNRITNLTDEQLIKHLDVYTSVSICFNVLLLKSYWYISIDKNRYKTRKINSNNMFGKDKTCG